jgi:probable O-glycosylation ligase (exosortase A-associated)
VLRTVFVAAIILAGLIYSLKGPFYAVLLYLWVAYFRPDAWLWSDWITQINLSFVVGILALALTLLFFREAKWRFNASVWVLALFFVQSLVSTWASLSPDWSWMWWGDFAKVLIIGYLIIVHTTDERRLRTLLIVIALSLGFESAKQGWAQLILNPGATNSNTSPVLGDNNGVALGMFMLVPVLGALGATSSKLASRALYWFLLAGVVFRGITTYSRGGFLCAAALSIMSIIRSKHRIRMVAAVVIVSALILPVMPQQFWDRMETIRTASDNPDESAAGRLYFWNVAVDMANTRPLVGIGFNAFTRLYDTFDSSRGAFGPNRAVHSVWFGLLSEVGIPGLALFVLLLTLAFMNCRAARIAGKTSPETAGLAPYATALETSLIVFVVGGTFLNAQYSEIVWHFICISVVLRELSENRLSLIPSASAEAVPLV